MPLRSRDHSAPSSAVAHERTLLVGAYTGEVSLERSHRLEELASLVGAAGGTVVARTHQHLGSRRDICAATWIGRGKVRHVAELASLHDVDLVVFDNELSPAQVRELEKRIGTRVLDRSEVTLAIFARRARTREARLQVELAQLQYTAPRLRGMWTHLERQSNRLGASGLGARGPGEKQIEVDRRLVGRRVARLRGELARIHARKEREVATRAAAGFCVGLVGYTNAGKSTLMNALTGAAAGAADQLFATVDTRTRRWRVEPGFDAMLSDTVGFVRELPHLLVASFRATLEEAVRADLLLHVIDASHPQAEAQIGVVNAVLVELGCDMESVVCVLNKIDRVSDRHDLIALRPPGGRTICISAGRGEGLSELERAVGEFRRRSALRVRLRAPAGDGRLQARARACARVRAEAWRGDTWLAELHLDRRALRELRRLCPSLRVTHLKE